MPEELQETERPHISLQQRLGRVLANGANTSSDEIRDLIAEADNAAQAAHDKGQYHHDRCLSMDCDDLVAEKNAEKAAGLERSRLEMCKPRLVEKLAAVVRSENYSRHMSDRNRVAGRRDSAAKAYRELRDIFADVLEIFQLAAEADAEVARINAANLGEPLLTVECYARNIRELSRSQPSITTNTQLPDWSDSQRMLWPPRPMSLGVLVAESMAASYGHNPAHTDQWASTRGERDEAIKAEQQRTAEYYSRQERERQEREAREDQERAQRSG
jgi:hypothetical protein